MRKTNLQARNPRLGVLLAGVALAACTAAMAAPKDDYRHYGGDQGGQRYSPLTTITKANVGKMAKAWQFDMQAGGSEMQPIVVDGVMYATTTDAKVVALDAATGVAKWSVALAGAGGGRGRGLTFWQEGNDRRILVPGGGFVYALNAADGQLIAPFGDGGKVDLKTVRENDLSKNAVNQGSPVSLIGNIFMTSGGVPENGPSVPGDLRGWDVKTGKLLWTFHTIPHPGEPGYDTWPADAYKTAGGVNAWPGTIGDEKNGIFFAALGSAADDFWGGERVGDNLYGNSIVALEAKTGKLLWHYQTVHHDMWDADFATPPILQTVTRAGKSVEAVTVTNKAGYIYIFDRKTGKPLFDIKEVAQAASDVEGEVASKTQPIPVTPAPLGLHSVTVDTLTNRSPEANASARAKLATMKNGPVFTPIAKGKDTMVIPGFSGGAEWGGLATDPKGVLYVNSENIPWYTSIIEQPRPGPGKARLTFSGYNKFRDSDGYPGSAPPWGTLQAIDMNTGKYLWKIPFGYYPELNDKTTGSESYGGPVITASGLMFIGATIYDRKLRAYDTSNGKEVWSTDLPYAGVATAITYMAGGEQYVAIAASGGRDNKGPRGAALVAYKLPK
jgi:quinoprotein glucose dehydrogenase